MSIPSIQLNTGAKIPAVGLGTWQSEPGKVKQAVIHALSSGYRHIDCAYVYGNEGEVGEGFAEAFSTSNLAREHVFITSKLWCTSHRNPAKALDETLRLLQIDYLDLYLMHWPVPMNPDGNDPKFPKLADGSRDLDKEWSHLETWKEMEKLLDTGKVKAIGVANYSAPFLQELLNSARIVPAVNQIENHPYLPQQEIRDVCQEKGIHITAYSAFGSTGSPLFEEKEIRQVAEKHKVQPGSVLLSYHVAEGRSVIPKSVTPSRIEENLKIVQLDSDDLEALGKVTKSRGFTRYVYPSFGINLGFPDKQ